MVFLNGEFLEQQQAKISTLDRGFLFGDGVYEVIPVYDKKIFQLQNHLQRLQNSLDAISIKNPYSTNEYRNIINKLITSNSSLNQSIYLQITRGIDAKRSHVFAHIKPTIYISSNELIIKDEKYLSQGFKAILREDLRWARCDIKAISLLANVLYANEAKSNGVEEVILYKNDIITEGATSNVFILINNKIFTPKISNKILAGITREMVIKSIKNTNMQIIEKDISIKELLAADEVWISSSTREITPIFMIDDNSIGTQKISKIWKQIYHNFQLLK